MNVLTIHYFEIETIKIGYLIVLSIRNSFAGIKNISDS